MLSKDALIALAIITRNSNTVLFEYTFKVSILGSSVSSFFIFNVSSSPRDKPESDFSEPIPYFSLSFRSCFSTISDLKIGYNLEANNSYLFSSFALDVNLLLIDDPLNQTGSYLSCIRLQIA